MALERTHDVKIECYEHESSPSPGTQDGELLAPDVRPAAEKQLVRTLDMRLLPALILIYLINGIDRAAVASARLKGLQQDLLLTDIQYEIVLAILYVSYIPAQLPSNMILNKISRPSYYISACVILWGVTSALTGVAHNYAGILSTRLFVGLPEAAFYPGGTYLLSRWYTRKELALRATIFTGGGLISIAFGSLIAAGILSSMEGQMGIRAWRWLFYFEGSITIVIGILTVFLLPDWPHNTRWLSPAQRRLAQVRLTEDAGEADEDNGSDSIFTAVSEKDENATFRTRAGTLPAHLPTYLPGMLDAHPTSQLDLVPLPSPLPAHLIRIACSARPQWAFGRLARTSKRLRYASTSLAGKPLLSAMFSRSHLQACTVGKLSSATTALLNHPAQPSKDDLASSRGLDELVWWLAIHHGLRKLLQKHAAERDEELRMEWRCMVADEFLGSGEEFVFVDETSKNDHTCIRRYGYAPAGERASITDVFIRGDRFSLVAAMAREGYLAARVVPGSFDSLEFYKFIVEDVLPQMGQWPYEPRSVLVLDNCRIHHSEELAQAVHDAGCLLLYLPSYSPDLNPIEESFATLKAYIRRHGHEMRTAEDPIDALLEACGCITAEKAERWFAHAGYITQEYIQQRA